MINMIIKMIWYALDLSGAGNENWATPSNRIEKVYIGCVRCKTVIIYKM